MQIAKRKEMGISPRRNLRLARRNLTLLMRKLRRKKERLRKIY